MIGAWRRRLPLVALGVAIMGAVGLRAWTPVDDAGTTFCVFRLCTGVSCPGCGLTRSAAWLVRGDFSRSWDYHPLLVPLLLILAGSWVWWFMMSRDRADHPSSRMTTGLAFGMTAALGAVWIVRFALGALPPV